MDDKTKKILQKEAKKTIRRSVKKKTKNGKSGRIVLLVVLLLIGALIAVGAFTGFFTRGEAVGYDENRLGVYFIDVGQGDSILLRSPEGRFMLIDAAKNNAAEALTKTLKDYGVKTIDYFILTHPDEDHVGGADTVLRNFTVKTVLSSDAGAATKTWRDVVNAIEDEGCADITVSPGARYTFFEGCRFTVLGPIDTGDASDMNNQSVVVRLEYGKTSFLFTGDAEKEEEEAMMKKFGASALRSDVLKVGHHGSSSSSSAGFLEAVDPSYAVISCGKDNTYGHPHAAALKRLSSVGAQILRTDERGTVIIQSDGQTLTVVDAPAPSPFEQMLERVKGWFR